MTYGKLAIILAPPPDAWSLRTRALLACERRMLPALLRPAVLARALALGRGAL
jgi:hypothetical protein